MGFRRIQTRRYKDIKPLFRFFPWRFQTSENINQQNLADAQIARVHTSGLLLNIFSCTVKPLLVNSSMWPDLWTFPSIYWDFLQLSMFYRCSSTFTSVRFKMFEIFDIRLQYNNWLCYYCVLLNYSDSECLKSLILGFNTMVGSAK
jgi:hypothetical protein